MKKTVLALAVAATAFTGVAQAAEWSEATTGSFTFGGTITADAVDTGWLWKIGDNLNFPDSRVSDLSGDEKNILTFNLSKDTAILLGKTKTTISPSRNQTPSISFSSGGSAVILKDSGESNSGKGYLDLPIKSADADSEDNIGTLRVNVTVAGVAVRPDSNTGGTSPEVRSLKSINESDELFHGGLLGVNSIQNSTSAYDMTRRMGAGVVPQKLLDDVKNVYPEKMSSTAALALGSKTDAYSIKVDQKLAAIYSMGISAGQQLVATFNTEPSVTTHWKAPLDITVTYN